MSKTSNDRNNIKKTAMEYAKDNMENKMMNCAEAVFDALIRSGAIDAPEYEVSYVTGFGSGAGGAGLTCGALTSAVLGNGVAHGRKDPSSSKDKTVLKKIHYKRCNSIVSEFVKSAGSGLCNEIVNAFPKAYQDEDNRPNCIRIVCEATGIAVDHIAKSDDEVATLEYDPKVIKIKNWL